MIFDSSRKAVTAALIAALVIAAGMAPVHAAAPFADYERISGATRYETAGEIADAYLVEQGGRRSFIDTVILTSGADEHFSYALTAPGLSRRYNAPLLLTDPERLSSAAANFISDNDIDTVFILGGTDVVSAAAERSVDRISGVSVTRIFDDDIYTSAVRVAERVGSPVGTPGRYGPDGVTALLATGEHFADALAAGPLAYRGEHPILLTPAAELHSEVASFLRRSGTKHVVILGGPAAVSTGVEAAVRSLGISVDRLAGADRFATAIRIAEELLGKESPQPCFDSGEIGLANGRKAPDALASAPLLGDLCAPLLLTEPAELPTSVEDFLESNEYVTGDLDGEVQITVFGGTAAIRRAVVTQTVNAATLDAINARIQGTEGRCHFTVTFDEPVRTADAEVVRNYSVDDRTLQSGDASVDGGRGVTTTRATVILRGAVAASNNGVPVGCSTPLVARENIELRGGAIGTTSDRRTVRRALISVSPDRSKPRLTITALDGADVVYIESSEAIEDTEEGTARVRFKRSGEDAEFADLFTGTGEFRHEVTVPYGDGLQAGDQVSVDAGEVQDLAGNKNSEVTTTTRRDNVPPRVSRVTVTEPAGRSAASIDIDGRLRASPIRGALSITAKSTGTAYGALGNDWRLNLEIDEDWPQNRPTEVDVSTSTQRIALRVGALRTLDQLADDLNDDNTFRRLFTASVDGTSFGDEAKVNDVIRDGRFSGGTSTVDLTVYWSEPVRDCDAGDGAVLPSHIELDVEGDGRYDFYLDGLNATRLAVTFVDAPDGNQAIVAETATCDDAAGVPPGTLVARLESARFDSLPSLSSRLIARKGAATDIKGNEAVNRRFDDFTRPQ